MSIILGLDVSTSVTGISIIDSLIEPDDIGSNILVLDKIVFKKEKTLWEKADTIDAWLKSISISIDRVVLEEPLLGFRPGMSSAQTISTLMRFNGIVSYLSRCVLNIEPEYIGSGHARKLCGIKLQKTAIGGPQKEQVFKHMKEHDLKHVIWELKKNGKEVDSSRDSCDAYVIARAAAINGPVVVEKKKKSKKKS